MILDLMLLPQMKPFLIAYTFMIGMFLLEVCLAFLGMSSHLDGDVDADLDGDFDAEAGGGGTGIPDTEFDGPDADGDMGAGRPGLDGLGDIDSDNPSPGGDVAGRKEDNRYITYRKTGLSGWLGLGTAPLTIWLALFCFFFGTAGYFLQMVAVSLTDTPVHLIFAVPAAMALGLLLTRRASGLFGRIMPRIESSAISEKSYGRRSGVVTTGVARRGHPAEVRFTDGHGTFHYTMVEPLDDSDEIPAGAEVRIMRTRDGTLRIIQTSD